ncbi:hypothetical protein BU16DRAFT_358078 [Lophium mytilinum]|uniref:Uncharacterized protein n=1 Tax=Lophium mytilinum TaxID=390894 RepID=A0A6A6QVV1_9PEZI|nr:hypothetical protein BU16DRAFT_358078 [Lophium mytilinum]
MSHSAAAISTAHVLAVASASCAASSHQLPHPHRIITPYRPSHPISIQTTLKHNPPVRHSRALRTRPQAPSTRAYPFSLRSPHRQPRHCGSHCQSHPGRPLCPQLAPHREKRLRCSARLSFVAGALLAPASHTTPPPPRCVRWPEQTSPLSQLLFRNPLFSLLYPPTQLSLCRRKHLNPGSARILLTRSDKARSSTESTPRTLPRHRHIFPPQRVTQTAQGPSIEPHRRPALHHPAPKTASTTSKKSANLSYPPLPTPPTTRLVCFLRQPEAPSRRPPSAANPPSACPPRLHRVLLAVLEALSHARVTPLPTARRPARCSTQPPRQRRCAVRPAPRCPWYYRLRSAATSNAPDGTHGITLSAYLCATSTGSTSSGPESSSRLDGSTTPLPESLSPAPFSTAGQTVSWESLPICLVKRAVETILSARLHEHHSPLRQLCLI